MSCRSFPSLYKTVLYSFVNEWNHLETEEMNSLPGSIKEDLLKTFLLHRKGQEHISSLLHPDIRKLDLNESIVTNEDLDNISLCVHIQILDISPSRFHRFDHSNSSLKKLFSSLPQLMKLHVQRNDGMTDEVISLLTIHCPLLRVLDLSSCTNLTDGATTSLATLAHIRALRLANTYISDTGLIALSEGICSHSLTELNLNNCIKITDTGINSVVEGCKKLSVLLLSGCPKISVECQLSIYDYLGKDKKETIVSWTVYI
uniref:F-box/LRR-repeat protein 15-like leucin rich repeat domain-containing protein n=1 Tax=Cuerna arida TaxID=1464854 RepID=A0A1B6GQX3_9HEMI